MRIIKTKKIRMLSHLLVTAIITFGLSGSLQAEEDQSAEQKALVAEEVQLLEDSLAEMKAMAPKLRVSLRSVRKQSGFNVRESHKVERNLSSSQKDMERLIAMHRRGAVSQMRAHFLVDDLRRKAEGLKESLAYIELHLQEQPGENGTAPDTPNENSVPGQETGLIQLLGRYALLVDNSLSMLQEKGF
jgi:hypothetical protein